MKNQKTCCSGLLAKWCNVDFVLTRLVDEEAEVWDVEGLGVEDGDEAGRQLAQRIRKRVQNLFKQI